MTFFKHERKFDLQYDYCDVDVFSNQINSYLTEIYLIVLRADSRLAIAFLKNQLIAYEMAENKSDKVKAYLLNRLHELEFSSCDAELISENIGLNYV